MARTFQITDKNSPMGQWYTIFMSRKQCDPDTTSIYEYAWRFYGAALDQFPAEWFKFKHGKKPMDREERKASEREFLAALKLQLAKKLKDRAYSPHTVNINSRQMKTFWNWMRETEDLVVTRFSRDDWAGINRTVPKGEQRAIYTAEELTMLIRYKPASYSQWRVWTICMLMMVASIRIEEALGIKTSDLNIKDSLLLVDGKGNKKRYVQLTPEVIPHLLRWQTKYVPTQFPDPYFFGTKNGTMMSHENAYKNLKILFRKCGILKKGEKMPKGKAWHSLRHTSATSRLVNGENIYTLSREMGHSDIKTTEKYLHLADIIMKGNDTPSLLDPNNKYMKR